VEGIDFRGWIDNRRDLPRLYNASKINLNLMQDQLKCALNLRCFDVPASGGFMLSNFKGDLLELFDEGETVWFEDIEDLHEKVRFYLKNPKEREKIRERARKRVLLEHTFYHRAKRVVEVMRGFI
jgi:spore maturation protein CgeB